MAALMPAVVVLIMCHGHVEPWPTQEEADNAAYTHVENWKWDYPDSKMSCKREEVQMYDAAAGQGAPELPFNPESCRASAVMLATTWDLQHRNSAWRVWRVACPVPIHATPEASSPIIGWKLPECGHEDTVTCLTDSAI